MNEDDDAYNSNDDNFKEGDVDDTPKDDVMF